MRLGPPNTNPAGAVGCLIILAWITGIALWVTNVVKLVGLVGGDITAELVIRAVGVFFVPLGIVMGLL